MESVVNRKAIVDKIFNDAKTLYKNKNVQGIHTDWYDYEKFKKQLHYYGLFGYEQELADILEL